MEQVEEEINALFDFMKHTYSVFGFEFSLELSTRPDNYLGTLEAWNEAEEVHYSDGCPVVSTVAELSFATPLSNSEWLWTSSILENGS
jgi:threonyl-tRNA synthetase